MPGWGLPGVAGKGLSLLGPGVTGAFFAGAGVGCYCQGNAGWGVPLTDGDFVTRAGCGCHCHDGAGSLTTVEGRGLSLDGAGWRLPLPGWGRLLLFLLWGWFFFLFDLLLH